MNQRDIAEIRRRLNPDRRHPTIIRGCYVGSDGHIISTFDKNIGSMAQEENEKFMALFKKVLSGTPGQNFLAIDYTTQQAADGAQHMLLDQLRDSALKDDAAVEYFFGQAAEFIKGYANADLSVDEAQKLPNYLVLMLHDGYDVPHRDNNDEMDHDRSAGVFGYTLCAVCPVKQSKAALRYFASEGDFHAQESDWVVGMPELGFMYPAFEERGANIYRVMYYTRNSNDLHDDFVTGILGADLQMTAGEQQETFRSILSETLADECSMEVVQTVHETIATLIEEQKADKTAEPLAFSKQDMVHLLEESGVSEEKTAKFEERYDESFGEQAVIPAVNTVQPKQFKVETPSVSIKVSPERSDLIETRMIDGKYYIMVLADGEVEVNGMRISME
ncbi:MAG: DUF4317 domain-containing protein [Clostridia bacterium]|nr:DUF4317 domain-containing protein [Clostridia bacterium]